jgi:hypothetical protein
LSWLAITALNDVTPAPCVTDGIDNPARSSLDCHDRLANSSLSRDLAGLLISPVDKHCAGGTKSGAASEFRASLSQNVTQHPQQRGLRVAICDPQPHAIDVELHESLLDCRNT